MGKKNNDMKIMGQGKTISILISDMNEKNNLFTNCH